MGLAVIAELIVCAPLSVFAQTFSVLHDFSLASGPNATNVDGANPCGALITCGNKLCGTTKYGGNFAAGTIYLLSMDGGDFATIYPFSGGNDGGNPVSELLEAGGTIYGAASVGGAKGGGTVFAVGTNGSGFTVLHSFTIPSNNGFGFFTNSDGAHPLSGLLRWGGTLYGTANEGGTAGHGTLFALNTDGTNFSTIHSSASGSGGTYASAGLVLNVDTLYGSDFASLGHGSIFGLITNGNSFSNYYAFTSGHLNNFGILTNSDGANPYCRLVLSGNTLYGTTQYGGDFGNGGAFAVNTDGSGFINLHSFTAGAYSPSGLFTNRDGANPIAGLTLSNGWLYGTTTAGGASGNGSIYALKIDGSSFTNLYSFSSTPPYPTPQTNASGANPYAGLLLSGTTLYGVAANGGSNGNGTVFGLSLAPRISISMVGTNVVLTWPSNVVGFDYSTYALQSASTLSGPFTDAPNSMTPFVVPAADSQQFFRLRSPAQ